MGIHEQELEIGQRYQPQFQGRTDGLTAVRGVQFPEKVVKMRLDRRHPQAKLLSQPFSWQTLGHAAEDLHFPRRQSDRFGCGRQRALLGNST